MDLSLFKTLRTKSGMDNRFTAHFYTLLSSSSDDSSHKRIIRRAAAVKSLWVMTPPISKSWKSTFCKSDQSVEKVFVMLEYKNMLETTCGTFGNSFKLRSLLLLNGLNTHRIIFEDILEATG